MNLNSQWKQALENYSTSLNGVDLSFADVPEYRRTKHVHRLHPYLGKFIPQIVEVFLKDYFKPGDWVLDPFLGSGTTIVEANVLGINSVGIEISEFNCLISKVKVQNYDLVLAEKEIRDVLFKTRAFSRLFLNSKNQTNFLTTEFRTFTTNSEYFNNWFSERALQEILYCKEQIKNYQNQDLLKVILSRATRSARQTPHYDLARPKNPVKEPYYCIKHKRICQPVDEALKFINRYSLDTIARLKEFAKIKTSALMKVIQGDSRAVRLKETCDGIFTSPPYVGLIDYHDQHKYAYELFGFANNDTKEIGPASKGKGQEAKEEYQRGIIGVFKNFAGNLKSGAKIFIVVNDRDLLYPRIAEECGFEIQRVFQRPVLMRTERDNFRFSESIYYLIKP